MKWGYEMIKAAFEFNLALTRSANFQGSRTGDAMADFMVGAFENSTVEFGIADHSPSTIKHQFFIEDSFRAYGPGDVNTDLALMRYFSLVSNVRLQLRGEFFNAFNQVNFNDPVTNVSSGNFGRITGAGSGRVIQVAAKLLW